MESAIKDIYIMTNQQQAEKPIVIPHNYSHLCIICAQLVDINEFKAIHRDHGNFINKPTLEQVTKEYLDDLSNYSLIDAMS